MRNALLMVLLAVVTATARTSQPADSARLDEETLRHFQALIRMDTADPPGNEQPAAEYLKKVLESEGIAVEIHALEARRPNVVARLTGSGRKRPLLIMGHTDVVNVDPKKWTHPPFGATRDGGYIYGRGTVDDKDNVVAGLMVMLMLKRQNIALDRDVIFLAESGEEGSTRVGIQYMVGQHFPRIDAEYCLAEGGSVSRAAGQVKFASVQTLEKIPRAIELTARGISGHGSVPLRSNAVVHLAAAVAKVAAWKPQIRLNDTTRAYFKRLASISSPAEAKRYLDVIGADAALASAADDYFLDREPRHASMLRTSVSPNIIQAGYRINVIPSEARASLDVRTHPDENLDAFLAEMKKVVDDPAVEVAWAARDVRPPSGTARLDSEAFKAIEANVTKHYQTITLPTMSTGATDMAYLRAKGMQCFGIGPVTDIEDGPKGFGAHSDQERILEQELYRFVRFHYDIVADLAKAR
jgi:acetylornithine deacetylase/succinyl-diaminopimelate desuccinylase-like protein